MLQLKKMELSEAPAIIPLFLNESQTRFWENGNRQDSESAAKLLGRYFRLPSSHWMMLWNTEIAGYGHLLRSEFLEGWVVSYIVDPKFQRLGIATAFVEEAKSHASNEGIEKLYASVHPANLASIRVVEKARFQLVEKTKRSEENLYQWLIQPKA